MTNSTIHEGQTALPPDEHEQLLQFYVRHVIDGARTGNWNGANGLREQVLEEMRRGASLSARVEELERINGELLEIVRDWRALFVQMVEQSGVGVLPPASLSRVLRADELLAQHSQGGAA